MNVFNNENILIGKVKDIIDNTAQPVLVIKNNSEEYLVPMVEKFVKDIDLVNSKIVINPIEGLI
jgi:16S rRNA processing protein RimM